jgi:hypothetical protein
MMAGPTITTKSSKNTIIGTIGLGGRAAAVFSTSGPCACRSFPRPQAQRLASRRAVAPAWINAVATALLPAMPVRLPSFAKACLRSLR